MGSLWLDVKYLRLISGRLPHFKQKSKDNWNWRCVWCGDSRKSQVKARAYAYVRKQQLVCYCHNCSRSMSFAKMLQALDPVKYGEYKLEKLANSKPIKTPAVTPDVTPEVKVPPTIQPISTLPANHPAVQYLLSRQIPVTRHDELYWTSNFKALITEHYPNAMADQLTEDERIVMMMTNTKGQITQVNGRRLADGPGPRYLKVKITNDDGHKVFGLNHIDLSKTVYVVEGEFDSMLLPNAVAAGSSALLALAKELPFKMVLVWDNEPHNAEIAKQMAKAILAGWSVVIWPVTKGKDINEMVLAGQDPSAIIRKHTFVGPEALLKFADWRRRRE